MSHESEDLLEEALRYDLPSREAETRLRRRLLGVGLAVGSGTATSVAAATGGTLAKAAALSWGVKLGLAAAVAIPAVGLAWDHAQPSLPRSAATTSPATPRATAPVVAAAPSTATTSPRPAVQDDDAAPEPFRARQAARRDEPGPRRTEAPAAPSRSEFAHDAPNDVRSATTLSEETRILDRAFAELAAGNEAAAAALVAEHEARYPRGLLVKERERAKIRLSELSRGE